MRRGTPRADGEGVTRCFLLFAVVACGGRTAAPRAPSLEPHVDGESWYSATTPCGQGPYELDIAAVGAKYGEEVELRMHTLHDVMFKAVVEVDGQPVQHLSIG